MYFAAALFVNFGLLGWFTRIIASYCFRNFALIVEILNLITTITQCRQTIYCAKEHSLKIQTAFKKWRCDNFLQNDDSYFLVEQTVKQS